jgi:hypothetical protein
MFNDTFTPKTHNTFVLNANDARKAFWREFHGKEPENRKGLLDSFMRYAKEDEALCGEQWFKAEVVPNDSLFIQDYEFLHDDYMKAYLAINARVMLGQTPDRW